MLTHLADLVEEIVACLDQAGDQARDEPLRAAVARCNTELESYLEGQREKEPPSVGAQDELRRLARQLRTERSEATMIVRRIRRVLGRVDARRTPGAGTR